MSNSTDLTLITFSPTGTSRHIGRAIAKGYGGRLKTVDLTRPSTRTGTLPKPDGTTIIAVPVYEEHVPFFLVDTLKSLQGDGNPAVLVVVYGNVGFGVALQELQTLAVQAGFRPLAAAAFIGEHSFSHDKLPVAAGRPDAEDLATAFSFGRQVAEKLERAADLGKMDLQGKLPLIASILPKNSARFFTKEPALTPNLCTNCGACSKGCPMQAIDPKTLAIDTQLCIRCFACVKHCPVHARSIELKKKWVTQRFLAAKTKQRRRPALFL